MPGGGEAGRLSAWRCPYKLNLMAVQRCSHTGMSEAGRLCAIAHVGKVQGERVAEREQKKVAKFRRKATTCFGRERHREESISWPFFCFLLLEF